MTGVSISLSSWYVQNVIRETLEIFNYLSLITPGAKMPEV